MKDFFVDKFYFYSGPNFYINKPAVVFNLSLDPDGPVTGYYKDQITKKFPALLNDYPDKVADLFTRVLVEVQKMDMNLFTRPDPKH